MQRQIGEIIERLLGAIAGDGFFADETAQYLSYF